MTVDSSRQNANNLHYTKNIFSRPLLDQARKCVGDEHYYNMRANGGNIIFNLVDEWPTTIHLHFST